jgi:hypothetical protein
MGKCGVPPRTLLATVASLTPLTSPQDRYRRAVSLFCLPSLAFPSLVNWHRRKRRGPPGKAQIRGLTIFFLAGAEFCRHVKTCR